MLTENKSKIVPGQRLVTIPRACQILGCSGATAYRMRNRGDLTVLKTPYGPRVDLNHLNDLIEQWSQPAE